MKRLNVISLMGCMLCLLLASCTPSPKNSDRYVVVLSMDGFRSDFEASDSDDATSLSSAHERGGRSIVQTSETGENNHRAIIPLKKNCK